MTLPTLRSDHFRNTHKASVFAILGNQTPRVEAKGSRFYNIDRWTVRFLTGEICQWAKKNPGTCPTRTDVSAWVTAANSKLVPHSAREIVTAAIPNELTVRVAMSLIGGGYHEAFHTKYSCRRNLNVDDIASIILPRWAKVADWSKLEKMLQEWNNVVEDIRIERRGGEEYPGVYIKMCDLQDFILDQEANGRLEMEASGHGAEVKKPLGIAMMAFRDIGLGYPTIKQKAALDLYDTLNPETMKLVCEGALSPLLDEAISLSATDDLGCLRLSFDIVACLAALADPKDLEQAQDQAQDSKQGPKPACPACGAKGSKLVARPVSDGMGGKKPGKLVITCTVCGWQEEVDTKPAGSGKPQKQDPEDQIKYEDSPKEDSPKSDSGKPDEKDGSDKKQPGDKDGSKGEKSDGSGSDGDTSDEDAGGSGDADSDSDKEGSGEGAGSEGTSDSQKPSDSKNPGKGAGGHSHNAGKVDPKALADLVKDLLAGKNTGMKDASSALEQAIGTVRKNEDKDCKTGEKPYRPFQTIKDETKLVEASGSGKSSDMARAAAMMDSVRAESSYMRSRLRSLVRSVEQQDIVHGVRKGRDLSERMLVDSYAMMESGQNPNRAYQEVDAEIDTSMAAVLVIDQSSSMAGPKQLGAAKGMMAVCDPLDSLGCQTMAVGFRDGAYATPTTDMLGGGYHRYTSLRYDIFKNFNERFSAAKWRFANVRAEGGTPMADGVQFGLDQLNTRKEGHRVLFVFTDGEPNPGHREVMRHQIRLATEAGIKVIGVGIGSGSEYVTNVFPDSVYAANFSDLPKLLMVKLTELLDFRTSVHKRGKKMKKA